MTNAVSVSWLLLVATAECVRGEPPPDIKPKLSVSSVRDQLGFKYEPLPPAEAPPPVFAHVPAAIEMEATLPAVEITAPKLKLHDNDVLTGKGRVEKAVNTYTSPLYRATFGPLSQVAGYALNPLSILGGWHPNEAESMALLREEQRRQSLDEMDSLIQLEKIGGGETKDLKNILRDDYISTR